MPDQKREAMAGAEAFASATARLDAAPSTADGRPDRPGHVPAAPLGVLSALQEQLQFLFETAEGTDSGAVVYGADRSAERLAPKGRGLDLAG